MGNGDKGQKLVEWLRGRNGSDELSTCAILIALILIIINLLLRSFVVSVIALVLMAYALFRMTSGNLEARENENAVFAEFLGPLRPWIRDPVNAFTEARAYKHLKCPECGKRMRVPRGKGKIRVKCPECQHKFETKS